MSDAEPASGRAGEDHRPSYRSVAYVGFFTLLSRITGLLREATRAHFLGTGLAADAFQVAFLLPSIFRRLVGEGAVSSAVVPVLAPVAQREGAEAATVLEEKLLAFWGALVLVVTVAGVLFGGGFVAIAFRWGSFSAAAKLELTAKLTSLLFWYLFFVGSAAVLQGILNARKIFAVPSTSPLLFNLVFVLSAWAVAPQVASERRVWVLAASVLAGGLFQVAVMLPSAWRIGLRPRLRWPFDHPGIRQVILLLVPAVFGAGIYQINTLVSTILAARLEEGAVASLSYSARLTEVVLGVFVFALSTVSLTSLSRQMADRDLGSFRSTLSEVLRWVLFITIPSEVGLWILRRPILAFLLQSGAFDARSLDMTAFAFRYHVLGLVFVGLGRVLVNGFYAMRDVKTPVVVASAGMIANLVLAWWLSEGTLGFAGIALASSLSALLHVVLLCLILARRIPEIRWRALFGSALRVSLATAGMVAPVALLEPWASAGGKWEAGLRLLVVIPLGAGAFFALARLLGVREARLLFSRMRASRSPPGAS